MIRVSVFGKKGCGACKAAVDKIVHFSNRWGTAEDTDIDFVDMETPDGLAEGAYRDVYEIPTVILEEGGQEVARWVKKVPLSREFKPYFVREPVDEETRDQGLH